LARAFLGDAGEQRKADRRHRLVERGAKLLSTSGSWDKGSIRLLTASQSSFSLPALEALFQRGRGSGNLSAARIVRGKKSADLDIHSFS
jgi:hypothetical protein